MGVTIKDIAKIVGVASPNVSKVLRGNVTCVSKAKLELIHKTARELGYCRNVSAQILRGEVPPAVAILSSQPTENISDEHILKLLVRLTTNFDNRNWACFLKAIPADPDLAINGVRELYSRGVRNFIIIGSILNRQTVMDFLKSCNCSYAQFQESGERFVASCYFKPMKKLWDSLSPEEKDHFYLITGKKKCNRLAALTAAGADPDKICFLLKNQITFSDSRRDEDGYAATAALLKEHPDAKIIFYVSDHYLTGGVRKLYEAGYRIGKDIRVYGVNFSKPVRFSPFPLWSMRHPLDEITEALCRQLDNNIDEKIYINLELCANKVALKQQGEEL